MIPELGHFALILALLLAALLGTLPLVGAHRGIPAWTALARPLAAGQFLFIAFAFGCLVYSFVNNDFSVLNVATNSNSQLPLQYRDRRVVGLARGLDAAVGVHARRMDVRRRALKSRHLPDEMVARVLGVMGLVAAGFLLFLLLTSNPFDRLFPRSGGRPRPEPAAAGSRHGVPSAAAVHGVRRLLGRLRVRDRGASRRPPGCDLGALVAAVDDARLVFPHLRHHARELVGLLRAGLGRLVVLGSGRERVVHALAHRHGADPLARRHRKAGHVQGVDGVARDLRVLALAARHVPRALRRADVGARVRDGSAPRRVHPGLPCARHRRLARAVRAARAQGQRRRPLRTRVARIDAAREQRAADRRRRLGAARHALPAFPRRAQPRQDFRRPAVLRCGVRAADDAARLSHGGRARSHAGRRRRCRTSGSGSGGRWR